MTTPIPAQAANITGMLAIELFKRMTLSAAVGVIAVGIMLYPHWNTTPWQRSLSWAIVMLAVFVLRVLVVRHGLQATNQGRNPIRFVNMQAFLCAMTGLGWASTLYIFDSMVMDQKFNLRLMIIAAALTFTVSSMAVFRRVFILYLSAISIPVLTFIVTHDYVRPWDALFPCGAFYIAMIAMVSFNANRHIRLTIADNLEILTLTKMLQKTLETEKQLRTELSIRVEKDELTGIFNRRGLLTQLNIELARCRRLLRSTAVLMIDIDHFKLVNDTYGHASGDLVILAIVEAVQTQLRDTDIFGRIGGEEFLVVLPALERESALATAERIRAFVAETAIPLRDHSIHSTVSIGISIYLDKDDTDRILARADDALYSAKRNGRNRVEVEIQES